MTIFYKYISEIIAKNGIENSTYVGLDTGENSVLKIKEDIFSITLHDVLCYFR